MILNHSFATKVLVLVVLCLNALSCKPIALEDQSTLAIKLQFINLLSATERRETMNGQLDLASVDYSAINAVVGRTLTPADIDQLVQDGIYDPTTRAQNPLSSGELGIYLSNLTKAIPAAIQNAGAITVTLEDDVVVPYDVEVQFKQALKAVPADWDILYLGCYQGYLAAPPNWGAVGPYTPSSFPEMKDYLYTLCGVDESQHVHGTPWVQLDGNCVAGLFAYALRPESAQKLSRLLVPMKRPIDLEIRARISNNEITAYCLNPELIRVNTTIPSTIRP